MKNKLQVKQAISLAVLALYLLCAVSCFFVKETARASSLAEQRYCDDENYAGGEDSSYNDNQTVYYDSRVIRDDVHLFNIASYGGTILEQQNICAPVAGQNVVVYYDRYYPNLIPDFEPGAEYGGVYRYYPDVGWAETNAMVIDLYNIMNTNNGAPGTSDSDFKNGLVQYFSNHGYSLSYSEFSSGEGSVNLNTLKTAIEQGKVALLLCSRYNFVYSFTIRDGNTEIVKRNSNVGHIMMVYGYMIVDYYKNGSVFQTDTYLYVCSGYSTKAQGYVRLNDNLTINNALITNVS